MPCVYFFCRIVYYAIDFYCVVWNWKMQLCVNGTRKGEQEQIKKKSGADKYEGKWTQHTPWKRTRDMAE